MRTKVGLAFLAALVLTACAGLRAREHVLLPILRLAWAGVAQDIEAGLANAVAKGDLDEPIAAAVRAQVDRMGHALEAGDLKAVLAVDWRSLTMALRGIRSRLAAGDIGPSVASSLAERLMQFNAAWTRLGAR